MKRQTNADSIFWLALASAAAIPVCGEAADAAVSGPTMTCTAPSVTRALSADPETTVIAVRAFVRGDLLVREPLLQGTAAPRPSIAARDLCMVKLRVGPGNPGPSGAPSTQAGIGIEVWLPAAAGWNGRIHNLGGGGYAGFPEITDPNTIYTGEGSGFVPSRIASNEGAVSAATDTGHALPMSGADGSFLMLPDGTVNRRMWEDFAARGVHVMTEKTKLLTQAFYGRPARFAYFEGCSTGGRQGNKEAQVYPQDYDGIVAGAPAINWTTFITNELYPQLVMQRELGGPIDPAKLLLASSAAVSDCDSDLTGKHIGVITDPARCHYDPSKDRSVLCASDGGSNATVACLTRREAAVLNRIWFGATPDGSAPDPAVEADAKPGPDHLWYGVARGAQLILAGSKEGKPQPFPIATTQVALNLGNPRLAGAGFVNASGNGADGWRALTYGDLIRAAQEGRRLQPDFTHINTDTPDLSGFIAHGGKMILYHGLADQVIPPQGTSDYVDRLARAHGGLKQLARSVAYYRIPGMGHCSGVGSVDGLAGVSPKANPPLPAADQFYRALVRWVESAQRPREIELKSLDGSLSMPVCQYPSKLHFNGGALSKAGSYSCALPDRGGLARRALR